MPIASASTSALRWVASRSPRSSTSATWRRASGRSPRSWRSRCSVAPRRPTSASLSTSAARSCRPRTRAHRAAVALGEALGDLREGRVDAAIAGGCEIPLSPLAFGAFDIIRALSAGHNDDPGHAARPFDAERDGFVMGEGAALLVLEEAEAAERRGARRRTPRCSATARRPTRITWSSHGPTVARPRVPPRSPSTTPESSPARSTTSTPTPHRRRSGTWPRRGPSRPRSASAPRPSRSAARRRCTAIRWERQGRSRRRSARWPSVTAGRPATVNLVAPEPELDGLLPGLLRGRPAGHLSAGAEHLVRVRRVECRTGARRGRLSERRRGRQGPGCRGHLGRAPPRRPRRRGCAGSAATRRARPGPSSSERTPPMAIASRMPIDGRERTHEQAADRHRRREDRRVDAHHPAAQAVRDGQLDRRVGRGRHHDAAGADRDHQQQRQRERRRQWRAANDATPSTIAPSAMRMGRGRPASTSPTAAVSAPSPDAVIRKP